MKKKNGQSDYFFVATYDSKAITEKFLGGIGSGKEDEVSQKMKMYNKGEDYKKVEILEKKLLQTIKTQELMAEDMNKKTNETNLLLEKISKQIAVGKN